MVPVSQLTEVPDESAEVSGMLLLQVQRKKKRIKFARELPLRIFRLAAFLECAWHNLHLRCHLFLTLK